MELPHIGSTCVICNRNDYLPFKCSHCDKTVCIDHKTNHGADCPLNKASFTANLEDSLVRESLKQSCDFCKKITLKLELTECLGCKNFHCLYHRHEVQHNCQSLVDNKEVLRKEVEEKCEIQKAALERLKEKCKNPTSVPIQPSSSKSLDAKNKNLLRRIKLMKIKQFARGPPNILQEDKIYFEIKFAHNSQASLSDASKTGNSIRIFTTPRHTIGRMIDWSADELNITNKNHLSGADQLVFKKNIPNGFLSLDSQLCFSHYLESGELEDGDDIVLTY